MAKVIAPLFSLSASGTIGDVITYVCGQYVRRAAKAEKFEYTEKRSDQQTKFSGGAEGWQSEENSKEAWEDFAKLVEQSGECAPELSYYMTGYQTFMSFYLDLGADGWPNYPLPPS